MDKRLIDMKGLDKDMLQGLIYALTVMKDCKNLEEARNKIRSAIKILTWRPEKEMEESHRPRGRMLRESDEEDDVVIFTSMDGKKWKIPRENLENAKWTYDVDELDGEMEQLFATKVKDINNKDIFVGVDILVDEDDIHYYGDFIINSKYEAECTLDGYEVENEEACDDFGIEPKSYNTLKKIYRRKHK